MFAFNISFVGDAIRCHICSDCTNSIGRIESGCGACGEICINLAHAFRSTNCWQTQSTSLMADGPLILPVQQKIHS
ncbi:unnamed protein product [Heterobilharzia americana]|nr:unnamed protein product [Heterobilharzia americana]